MNRMLNSKKENPNEDKEFSHLQNKFVDINEFQSITPINEQDPDCKIFTAFYNNEKILIRSKDSKSAQFIKEADTLLGLESNYLTPLKYVSWEKIFCGYNYYLIVSHPGRLLSDLFTQQRLSVEKCLSIALDLAYGLEYLHRNGIVCEQIRPYHILLDSKNSAKLTNLGGSDTAGSFYGLSPYEAPHEFKGLPVADIFSFGMLLLALVLWEENPPAFQFGRKLSNDQLLLIENTPTGLNKLIHRCLILKAESTPTASELITSLKQTRDELLTYKLTLYSFFTQDVVIPTPLIEEISEYANLGGK